MIHLKEYFGFIIVTIYYIYTANCMEIAKKSIYFIFCAYEIKVNDFMVKNILIWKFLGMSFSDVNENIILKINFIETVLPGKRK